MAEPIAAEPEPTSEVVPPATPPPSGKDADKYIGSTIDGRYVVESVLGEGGTGVVYKCRRKVFEKTVAVKILRSDYAKNQEAIDRFVTVAKAASAIGHPHVVDIFDFGELPDGSTYLAMEYLEGKTLGAMAASGELKGSTRVMAIGRQIADGVAAAHAAKIVHRDLRPDNVFIIQRAGKDFVKILDFGMAEVAGKLDPNTRADTVVGTLRYMSPEQCRGTVVDHRTDIYSLGVILYELVTGRVPFDAEDSLGISSMHMNDAPRPFQAFERAVEAAPGLESLILECLAKAPEERFQSMTEVSEALARIERGEPVESQVPSSVAPPAEAGVDSARVETPPASTRPSPASESAPSSPHPAPAPILEVPEWRPRARRRWPWAIGVVITLAAGISSYAVTQEDVRTLGGAIQGGRPLVFVKLVKPAPAPKPLAEKLKVSLVLSPIDAHVFRDGNDLGTMPVDVEIVKGESAEIEVRRSGYWTRKLTLDGSKTRETVGLAPRYGAMPPHASGPAESPEAPAATPPAKQEWKLGEPADPSAP